MTQPNQSNVVNLHQINNQSCTEF